MIFKPVLAAKVLDGTKTVTRRLRTVKGARYTEGKVYSVQPGRGKHHVGHIEIRRVTAELLGDIFDPVARDWRREGFKSAEEFKEYWTKLNKTFDPQTPVWRISFRLDSFCDDCWNLCGWED